MCVYIYIYKYRYFDPKTENLRARTAWGTGA